MVGNKVEGLALQVRDGDLYALNDADFVDWHVDLLEQEGSRSLTYEPGVAVTVVLRDEVRRYEVTGRSGDVVHTRRSR
jgi:hypothetical protein